MLDIEASRRYFFFKLFSSSIKPIICHKAACMKASQPRPGSIIARSTAQRPETRRKPRAFRGTDAKEFPILAADYAADLLKRVARAEPERVNAREWIILLYSAVFILVTWFLAVLLAIYNRNTSPTGLKARRAQELR